MSASDELVRFGYTAEADGSFVKYKAGRPREKWQPADGGFLRFTRDDGTWAGVPYTVHPMYEGVSGLTFEKQPQCFLTVYPEAYVEHIYAVGADEKEARLAENIARKAAE